MIYNGYSENESANAIGGNVISANEQKHDGNEVSQKGKKRNVVLAYEHKPIVIEEWGFTKKELACLERLDRLLGGAFFKLNTKEIRFTNWVGVIGIGRRTIEILPKIDYTKNDNPEENKNLCRDRLLAMLAIAGDIPYKLSTKASLSSKNIPLLEFFIRLYVKEACNLLKRGLVHNYIKHEDEITFLRGKLNVAEQVRLTVRRIPRFSVRYHEFSADILLNRIIKDVSRMLQSITQNYENQRELLLIDAILEDVSFKRHTAKDVDRIILDRKTYGYEMLLALCRLFLQKRIPDFSAGETPVIPILFDMNKLFERFIGRMLKKMIHNKGFIDESFPYGNILLSAGNIKSLLKNEENKDVVELRPDIRLFKDSNDNDNDRPPTIIIDTKWKKLEPEKESKELKGIEVGDIRQMYAYATKYQPDRTILLYPKTSLQKNKDNRLAVFYVDESKRQTIEAWTIDLASDLSDSNKNTFYKSIKDQLEKIVEWTVAKNGKSKAQ